jgi:hypothetical protein
MGAAPTRLGRACAALRGAGRPVPREPMDYPAVAAVTFLVATAGLVLFSLPFEGYIRSGWQPAWCGMAASSPRA